jgi:hypothetical protein
VRYLRHRPTFQKCLLPPSPGRSLSFLIALMMEAVGISEGLLGTCQTATRNIPDDSYPILVAVRLWQLTKYRNTVSSSRVRVGTRVLCEEADSSADSWGVCSRRTSSRLKRFMGFEVFTATNIGLQGRNIVTVHPDHDWRILRISLTRLFDHTNTLFSSPISTQEMEAARTTETSVIT